MRGVFACSSVSPQQLAKANSVGLQRLFFIRQGPSKPCSSPTFLAYPPSFFLVTPSQFLTGSRPLALEFLLFHSYAARGSRLVMSVDKEVVASPPTADEKTPYDSVESNDANNVNHERPSTNLLGAKSPGVQRIEAVSQHIQNSDRIFIFLGIFLVAYAYGLDGMIRFTYQVRF